MIIVLRIMKESQFFITLIKKIMYVLFGRTIKEIIPKL